MKTFFKVNIETAIVCLLLISYNLKGADQQEKALFPTVFELNFNDGLKANFKGTSVTSKKDAETHTFIDGINGKALLCGKTSLLNYDLPKTLSMQSGSILFWVKWMQPDADSYLFFIRLIAKGEQLTVYRYPHPHLGLLALRQGSKKGSLSATKQHIDAWKKTPQKWHCIVTTWNSKESRLYLDGVMINSNVNFGNEKVIFDKIMLGMQSVKYINKGLKRVNTGKEYALDEIAIYDFVLSPKDVFSFYKKHVSKFTEMDNF